MTPEEFVNAIKQSMRDGAAREIDYYANPPVANPPGHLGQFSTWFRKLSAADQAIVRDIVEYAHEGALFQVLMYLDNSAKLTDENGELELWYTNENGDRARLNDPDGEMLQDLFNTI